MQSAGTQRGLISIVCPAFNESANVSYFYGRIAAVADQLASRYDFEFIFTDNRSVDTTRDEILKLRQSDPRVKLLALSRNFGYQASVLCGLSHARGDASVVIDIDCEDPPELVVDFVAKWEEGYDVVYGIRSQRIEPAPILAARRLFYWLLRRTGDNDIVMYMAEFALLTRAVREQIIRNSSTFPFLRTEIGYVGFNRVGVPYWRQPRKYGKTHYNLIGMTVFAIGGVLSSSTFLLRVAAYCGAALLVINAALIVAALTQIYPAAEQLLTMLDLMYLVFFLSVMSVYIARIYKNGVRRPVFIIDWSRSEFPEARRSVTPLEQ